MGFPTVKVFTSGETVARHGNSVTQQLPVTWPPPYRGSGPRVTPRGEMVARGKPKDWAKTGNRVATINPMNRFERVGGRTDLKTSKQVWTEYWQGDQ